MLLVTLVASDTRIVLVELQKKDSAYLVFVSLTSEQAARDRHNYEVDQDRRYAAGRILKMS